MGSENEICGTLIGVIDKDTTELKEIEGEIDEIKWISSAKELLSEIKTNPEIYCPWMLIALELLEKSEKTMLEKHANVLSTWMSSEIHEGLQECNQNTSAKRKMEISRMKKTKQIEKNAKTVNKYLKSKLKGNPKKLYDAAGHLIVHGGKRLRPYMVIRSCQILGGKASNAMPAASAVEMVHNFTLVHDDIMDNDEMRHGVPTVHKKFGMPIAILAGDVLFSKAYQVITDIKIITSCNYTSINL